MKKLLSILLVLGLLLSLAGCPLLDTMLENVSTYPSDTQASSSAPTTSAPTQTTAPADDKLDPEGFYYTKEDVALYIHQYGHLPENFVTKSQAKSEFGSNFKAMKAGYRVGGDTFQNREGLLPKKSGRTYTECDIVAEGGTERGACRIVFSNDGLVYYTGDHYASFTLLYGEP